METESRSKCEGKDSGFIEVFKWVVLGLNFVFMFTFFLWFVHLVWNDPGWFKALASEHYPVVIGLPFVAICCLGIVVLVEITEGEIEVKLPGVSFKGTAGQAILWLTCFMGMSISVKLLW